MTRTLLVAAVALVGCGGRGEVAARDPELSDGGLPDAPWALESIDASAVPGVYLGEWREAENRASCALIAPIEVDPADATPRAATFSGGWAVAYDVPGQRSAFGIAGTGSTLEGDVYDAWPHRVEWSDGSAAGYGPEGGSGPSDRGPGLSIQRLVGAGRRAPRASARSAPFREDRRLSHMSRSRRLR